MMTNISKILDYLSNIDPDKVCDDCISLNLNIFPRQQVNQICRNLVTKKELIRSKGLCKYCEKEKILNSLKGYDAKQYIDSKVEAISLKTDNLNKPYDIENIRNEIVRICFKLRKNLKTEKYSEGIIGQIIQLRKDNIIPFHQASMMITLCNLRNLYVYDDLNLSSNEMKVISGAWGIILDWIKENINS